MRKQHTHDSAIDDRTAASEEDLPLGRGGPPFWEEWRGKIPDEEIEFVRIIFEDFCGSWE